MKFTLKYKNIDVLKMELSLYPEGIHVLHFILINENLLPMGLTPFFHTSHDKTMQSYLLSEWLMKRSIPDYRINIDDFVLSIHHLQRHLFGRMSGYQHTAALLSYFSSGFDHYTIEPEKRELIYFGKQDGRFINLYNLEPRGQHITNEWNMDQTINEYLYKQVDQTYPYMGCFPTESFTIPSAMPSWWQKSKDQKLLIQKCDSTNDKRRAKILLGLLNDNGITGKREFDGTYFVTDFTDISEYDVTWLGELIPYINDSSQIRNQLELIIAGEENSHVVKHLFLLDEKMKTQGYDIGINEMGIAHGQNNLLPIVIL